MMRRLHWFEFGDQPWFPALFRDLLTDSLQFGIRRFRFYTPALPLISELLESTGQHQVIDLCSGGTGPWLDLVNGLRERGHANLAVTFTDKFVSRRALGEVEALGDPRLSFHVDPVDATSVPEELAGVRTLFTSFHHFTPDMARRVLGDAVAHRSAIGVFEFTERSLSSCLVAMFVPFAMFLTTPFMRPLSLARFVFTYLLPVVPLCNLWDGVVSNLRTYSADELRALVAGIPSEAYSWEIGRITSRVTSPSITYLIGTPR